MLELLIITYAGIMVVVIALFKHLDNKIESIFKELDEKVIELRQEINKLKKDIKNLTLALQATYTTLWLHKHEEHGMEKVKKLTD